jgi:enoyl-CoA hydratase/carnithine racemase
VRGALSCGASPAGANLARELILTGEPLDAVRAHAVGWVNQLAEPGSALAQAMVPAHRIAGNAPLSIQAVLGAVNGWLAERDAQGWAATAQALAVISGSDDVNDISLEDNNDQSASKPADCTVFDDR